MARIDDLIRFYALLDLLEMRIGGRRRLSECSGRSAWPRHGVYFFFENGERRSATGEGSRVVRVGTHALVKGSKSTLWKRLSRHRGRARSVGGDHRRSVFRLLIGTALTSTNDGPPPQSWGRRGVSDRETLEREARHEERVSAVIRAMPFLWLDVDDEPGPNSDRRSIERNAIALLSNYQRSAIDPPSTGWLGCHCTRKRVRPSGLWNQQHVNETHDPKFLDVLGRLVG